MDFDIVAALLIPTILATLPFGAGAGAVVGLEYVAAVIRNR